MSRELVNRAYLRRAGETSWETSIRVTLWVIAALLAGILILLADRL